MRLRSMAAGMLLLPLIAGAEPATASKNDNMREKPFIDSKVVLALKKDQKVDIQKRQGSWYYVKSGAVLGWAPMLSIHRTAQTAPVKSGSLTQTNTGRTSGSGVVSTTGVRGLDEENLKTAVFSEDSVAKAEKFRITTLDSGFAVSGGLKVQPVPELKGAPEPQGTQSLQVSPAQQNAAVSKVVPALKAAAAPKTVPAPQLAPARQPSSAQQPASPSPTLPVQQGTAAPQTAPASSTPSAAGGK